MILVEETDLLNVFVYDVRYRTDIKWYKLPPVRANEAEVTDMIPGEKYVIQVNTVSFGVESTEPLEVTQTVRKYSHTCLIFTSRNQEENYY